MKISRSDLLQHIPSELMTEQLAVLLVIELLIVIVTMEICSTPELLILRGPLLGLSTAVLFLHRRLVDSSTVSKMHH